ncbi:MAG TPA: DNA cytosine methyltransferase [Rhodothermales bacterium]|nr:DNA cytosine methyltransferase [Rhodothermales bacterium]
MSLIIGFRRGEIDLIAGCPPCQGFSALRTMNGRKRVHDPRNSLIREFFRFVDALRPRTVMLENVPGLAKEKLFREFCTKLSRIGYQIDWAVVDVAAFGVPQRRKRLILIAARNRKITLLQGNATRRTVREAIGGLTVAGDSGDPAHDLKEKRNPKV